MFEDLMPNKDPDPIPVDKDSLIEAMKENIQLKEDHIHDLLDELSKRNIRIDDLTKELDYLKQL